jgi:hypothetical protein
MALLVTAWRVNCCCSCTGAVPEAATVHVTMRARERERGHGAGALRSSKEEVVVAHVVRVA